MNFNLTKQTKLILLFAFGAALLGGFSYGGCKYWQSRYAAPAPKPQEPQEALKEKKAEIVENEGGSKTYFSYTYNYKITVPEGWEVIPSAFYTSDLSIRKQEAPAIEDLDIFSRPAEKGVIFRDYLERERQNYVEKNEEELIPYEPNFKFSGVPVYRYVRYYVQAPEVLLVVFEHRDVWYEISIPIQFKEDSEYWSILDTFEFLEER